MRPGSFAKPFYLASGYACVALGGVGVFLPLLPTTPFLLLAVWCFARSNPDLARRIEAHPRFGPTLVAWREHRIIPKRAKFAAIAAMLASFVLAWVTIGHPVVLIGLGLILASVSLYILTRPSGR
ncbi:YbaN family protein [Aurantimonas sp. A2-1-M11]|uniref:YbaN family protein n=1 Tax=Aurantimonas sp. A2-1-M11 TaxID=3113712 RepID=UPI002F944415